MSDIVTTLRRWNAALRDWLDAHVFELGREMRLSYLPPMMVYLAAGISGLTTIVGTFFVKEYLGLSAEFLAALAFWAVLPWLLKIPMGHLVDLIWRHKAGLVYLGALLLAASPLIMVGLLTARATMEMLLPADTWFIISSLLGPTGFALQDTVADAMTVEAVPRVDKLGRALPEDRLRLMNATMQTLGRVANRIGSLLMGVVTVVMFAGVAHLPQPQKFELYTQVYLMALSIPALSVAGVLLSRVLWWREISLLTARGVNAADARRMLSVQHAPPPVDWTVLGGGLVFAMVSIALGMAGVPGAQEIIFIVSMTIVIFLMVRLARQLSAEARATLLGTAVLIFIHHAMPGPGVGVTWWTIDVLGFDQQFFAKLSLTASVLGLVGLFVLRRYIGTLSVLHMVAVMTVADTLLALPPLVMFHGLHEWTAAHTGGIVDARFITMVDTVLTAPLSQIAMVPMLVWIARSAPDHLKATYFAVVTSFIGLAEPATRLGTKYLNRWFVITREVRDPLTNIVSVAADYSHLGDLVLVAIVLGLLPLGVIVTMRLLRLRCD